jgi:hypothetical protein
MAERFELVLTGGKFEEVSGETESKEIIEPKSSQEVAEKVDSKVIGGMVAKGIGVATMVYGISANLISQNMAIANNVRGDSIAQRKLDNTMAYVNESVGFLGSVAIGGIIAGPVGVAMALSSQAVKYGMKAINVAMQTQAFVMNMDMEKNLNRDRQARFVKDITGGRV